MKALRKLFIRRGPWSVTVYVDHHAMWDLHNMTGRRARKLVNLLNADPRMAGRIYRRPGL